MELFEAVDGVINTLDAGLLAKLVYLARVDSSYLAAYFKAKGVPQIVVDLAMARLVEVGSMLCIIALVVMNACGGKNETGIANMTKAAQMHSVVTFVDLRIPNKELDLHDYLCRLLPSKFKQFFSPGHLLTHAEFKSAAFLVADKVVASGNATIAGRAAHTQPQALGATLSRLSGLLGDNPELASSNALRQAIAALSEAAVSTALAGPVAGGLAAHTQPQALGATLSRLSGLLGDNPELASSNALRQATSALSEAAVSTALAGPVAGGIVTGDLRRGLPLNLAHSS